MSTRGALGIRLGVAGLCAGLIGAGQAAAQSPRSAWSLSVEGVIAASGEELGPFVEGAGLGVSATVGYALSPRWRLLVGSGATWFDSPSDFDPEWRVLQGRAMVGVDLLSPASRADLLVTLGGGVASFDPSESLADVEPPPRPLPATTVPSVVAGLRLGLPLSDGLGIGVAPRVVRTIPVGDDEPGPDSSWMWELAAGLTVGL